MKTRKWLSLLLTLILLIGILCGCGSNDSTLRDDDDDDYRRPSASIPNDGPITPADPDDPAEPTRPNQAPQTVDLSSIIDGTDFSEGKAFIRTAGSDLTYCIDKEGNVLFTLDGEYICGTYHNGIAFVTCSYGKLAGMTYICTSDGQLITAEDLGGSYFKRAHIGAYGRTNENFFGDYILIEKHTFTSTPTKFELGILNCNLEYVVEPSEELYNVFNESFNNQVLLYGSVIVAIPQYSNDWTGSKYLDLRTGVVETDYDIAISLMNITHESDFWQTSSYCYIDRRNNTVALDLNEQGSNITLGRFENGQAPITYYDRISQTRYFNIINESGQTLFEQYEIPLLNTITTSRCRSQNTYIVSTNEANEDSSYLTLMKITENGLVNKKSFPFAQTINTNFISLSDNIIRIADPNLNKIIYLDENLEPLF